MGCREAEPGLEPVVTALRGCERYRRVRSRKGNRRHGFVTMRPRVTSGPAQGRRDGAGIRALLLGRRVRGPVALGVSFPRVSGGRPSGGRREPRERVRTAHGVPCPRRSDRCAKALVARWPWHTRPWRLRLAASAPDRSRSTRCAGRPFGRRRAVARHGENRRKNRCPQAEGRGSGAESQRGLVLVDALECARELGSAFLRLRSVAG